ncbi:MAG: VUT family protein [Aeromonas veronii]
MYYVIIYVSAICSANLLVAAFGPSVTPINAFILIALDMTLRDRLHDLWAGKGVALRMACLISLSGLLSYAINPASGMIAIASVAAFAISATIDSLVYQSCIKKDWHVKSNASNIAGAAADSVAFPLIAFGYMMPGIVLAQFAAKVIGGVVWSFVIGRYFKK